MLMIMIVSLNWKFTGTDWYINIDDCVINIVNDHETDDDNEKCYQYCYQYCYLLSILSMIMISWYHDIDDDNEKRHPRSTGAAVHHPAKPEILIQYLFSIYIEDHHSAKPEIENYWNWYWHIFSNNILICIDTDSFHI